MIRSFNYWVIVIPAVLALSAVWGWFLVFEDFEEPLKPKIRFRTDEVRSRFLAGYAIFGGTLSTIMICVESWRGIMELFGRDTEVAFFAPFFCSVGVGVIVGAFCYLIAKMAGRSHWVAIHQQKYLSAVCDFQYRASCYVWHRIEIAIARFADWFLYHRQNWRHHKDANFNEVHKRVKDSYRRYKIERNELLQIYARQAIKRDVWKRTELRERMLGEEIPTFAPAACFPEMRYSKYLPEGDPRLEERKKKRAEKEAKKKEERKGRTSIREIKNVDGIEGLSFIDMNSVSENLKDTQDQNEKKRWWEHTSIASLL